MVTSLSLASDEPGVADGDGAEHVGLVRRLAVEFPTVDERYIELVVRETAGNYRDVRIAQFVPIFVERESRKRLRGTDVPAARAAAEDQQPEP